LTHCHAASRAGAAIPAMVTLMVLASWEAMTKSASSSFPVTVTHLPVARCQICDRTVAYRPGKISEVLTEHYRRAHPKALGSPSQQPTAETFAQPDDAPTVLAASA
jgi:hypothetical protein